MKNITSKSKHRFINIVIFIILLSLTSCAYAQENDLPKWRISGFGSIGSTYLYDSKIKRKFDKNGPGIVGYTAGIGVSYLRSKKVNYDVDLKYEKKKSRSRIDHSKYKHDYVTTDLTFNYAILHSDIKPLLKFLYPNSNKIEEWTYLGIGFYGGYMVKNAVEYYPPEYSSVNRFDGGLVARLQGHFYKKDNNHKLVTITSEFIIHVGLTRVLDYKIVTFYPYLGDYFAPMIRVNYML